MTELPKIGWYVELPDDKNHIDLDKLNKALNKEYEFYYENGVDKICKYYAVKSNTCICCTDYFEYVKHLENVTHLFLYTLDNLPEKWFVEYSDEIDLDLLREKLNGEYQGIHNYYGIGKKYRSSRQIEYFDDCINLTHLFKKQEQKMETIEIDSKKYRLVPEQANFKNCDIVMKDGKEYEFIGYYEADVILRECIKGELSQHENVGLFKLEEIKTKIWHYAIYRDEYGLCHSDFYSPEESLSKDYPNAIEYRTFEEQL
ncbi:hypothetical protein [Thorsellia anophelis]|uniref:Uncharacterized protein n=1 Tax=Thorsellia anophelis DSM 18579 TaxID=1123402 RepID=A0A1I0FR70_9GAMM|nr:hypothetical protein [Thorsellia anophelis]SET60121.1 hypothetical protein SAMN02583745_02843 [Thorsellia anophelis DSM 18579]